MLRILGSPKTLCDGVTRREFMQIGGLGLLGVGLGDYFRLQELQAESPASPKGSFGKAKSCILLLPYGSPPQHETFDPKPDAPLEIRGEIGRAIATSVPGLHVGEYLPKVARIMDRLTVVRSMTHPYPLHCTAYVVSGIPTYQVELELKPRDPRHWPYLGSVVDYAAQRAPGRNPSVPRNIALPWKMNVHSGGAVFAGPYAAFLGTAFDPVCTDFQGEATRTVWKRLAAGQGGSYQVRDPYAGVQPDCRFMIKGAERPTEGAVNLLKQRRSLLDQLRLLGSRWEAGAPTESYDRFQKMAYALLSSTKLEKALDIGREDLKRRESYGLNLFGQSCLAARRLVEAGAKFVTVFWDEYGARPASDWDTHYDHFYRLKQWLLPGFDRAFAALIMDLEARGMLGDTLVVWMSEHGRTPMVNKNPGGGRDHWSRAYSIALAGGGVGRGHVVGRTDRIGADVADKPVSPKEILATIFHLLGIDPNTLVRDRLGRPYRIAGDGEVRRELF